MENSKLNYSFLTPQRGIAQTNGTTGSKSPTEWANNNSSFIWMQKKLRMNDYSATYNWQLIGKIIFEILNDREKNGTKIMKLFNQNTKQQRRKNNNDSKFVITTGNRGAWWTLHRSNNYSIWIPFVSIPTLKNEAFYWRGG